MSARHAGLMPRAATGGGQVFTDEGLKPRAAMGGVDAFTSRVALQRRHRRHRKGTGFPGH